jgi:hypothetical protein
VSTSPAAPSTPIQAACLPSSGQTGAPMATRNGTISIESSGLASAIVRRRSGK